MGRVPSRRHSTIREPRASAREVPKSIELEQRVARVELALKDMRDTLDVLTKQFIALQAQLDHVAARVDRH
jgi:hypothetical protein